MSNNEDKIAASALRKIDEQKQFREDLIQVEAALNALPAAQEAWQRILLQIQQLQAERLNLMAAPKIESARRMGEVGGDSDEQERLAFEAWMKGHCWSLSAVWNGKGYIGPIETNGFVCPHATRTRGLWAAWRDRAALVRSVIQASNN